MVWTVACDSEFKSSQVVAPPDGPTSESICVWGAMSEPAVPDARAAVRTKGAPHALAGDFRRSRPVVSGWRTPARQGPEFVLKAGSSTGSDLRAHRIRNQPWFPSRRGNPVNLSKRNDSLVRFQCRKVIEGNEWLGLPSAWRLFSKTNCARTWFRSFCMRLQKSLFFAGLLFVQVIVAESVQAQFGDGQSGQRPNAARGTAKCSTDSDSNAARQVRGGAPLLLGSLHADWQRLRQHHANRTGEMI